MFFFQIFFILLALFLLWDFNADHKQRGIEHPENFKCIREEEINKRLWKFFSKFHEGIIYSVCVGWKENKRVHGLQEPIRARVIPVILLYLCYLHYALLLIALLCIVLLFVLYNDLELCCKFTINYTIVYVLCVIAINILLYFIDKHREGKKYD